MKDGSLQAGIISGENESTLTLKVPGAPGYVALTDLSSLPVGSILDTREGAVTLNTALPPEASARLQAQGLRLRQDGQDMWVLQAEGVK